MLRSLARSSFIFCFFCLFSLCAIGQTRPKAFSSKTVDVQAKFIGGRQILAQMFSDSMRYPRAATIFNIKGTVPVAFVINEKGLVESARVASKKRVGYGCEEEAIRLIHQTSGRWAPAKIKNKPVRQHKLISIRFNQGYLFNTYGIRHVLDHKSSHDSLVLTSERIWGIGEFPDEREEEPSLTTFPKSASETVYKETEVGSNGFLTKGHFDEDGVYTPRSFIQYCLTNMMRDSASERQQTAKGVYSFTTSVPKDSIKFNKVPQAYTMKYSFTVEKDGSVSNLVLVKPCADKSLVEFYKSLILGTNGQWIPAVKNKEFVRSKRELSVFYVK